MKTDFLTQVLQFKLMKECHDKGSSEYETKVTVLNFLNKELYKL